MPPPTSTKLVHVTFDSLWENHPSVNGDDIPCKTGDRSAFDNQCAIRMGVCLERSGINTKSFSGERCWFPHSPKHILRAEELAKWLKSQKQYFPSCEINDEKHEVEKFFKDIRSKKGIIFFKDYYGQGLTGDHIDLWNGYRLTKLMSIFAFLPLLEGINPMGSNYADAKQIWYWPVM